jgi:hypothetical protein
MQITVLIEPTPGDGFRARSAEPLAASAEGATRDEAIGRLRDELVSRLAHGAEILAIDLPATPHPWLPFAGTLAGDPLLADWSAAIAEHRRPRSP